MSFSGFSEDDIRKLTKSQEISKPQKGINKKSTKKVTFKSHSTPNTSRTKNNVINNTQTNPSEELSDEAKLSIPNETTITNSNCVNEPSASSAKKGEERDNNSNTEIKKLEQSSSETKKIEMKIRDLDEFEARQKLIEEQNRKRKELLAKALADRTKRTQEEVQRLNEIQEEFKKLDAMLSSDVKILRKQIEAASIEYMECQKRYIRIEKEFLDAKMLLHQKLEKKEMLTEHLCTIIEKNEERKAEKLTELLQKLEVKVLNEDMETEEKSNTN